MSDSPEKKKRGFAAQTPERRRQIARKGGLALHQQGKGHYWNSETASEASGEAHIAGVSNIGISRKAPRVKRAYKK